MALYNVAAGVLPPGEVQYFLLAIASIISFVFIGAFDSPRTFAAASRQLNLPAVLVAGFLTLLLFFVDMVYLLRGGDRRHPRGDHRPPSGAADPTANRSGQLPLCRGHLKRCRSEFLLDLQCSLMQPSALKRRNHRMPSTGRRGWWSWRC